MSRLSCGKRYVECATRGSELVATNEGKGNANLYDRWATLPRELHRYSLYQHCARLIVERLAAGGEFARIKDEYGLKISLK